MRLEVLRATAICWYGNEFLLSPDEANLTELNLKSCFKGCERLEFVRPTAHRLAAPGAAFVLGTKTWFRRLKTDRIESLRLHLPLSLLEPLPAVYGVVTDSVIGNDIWVRSNTSTIRNVEYDAQRFAAWSLPRPKPSCEVLAQLEVAIAELRSELEAADTMVGRRIERLSRGLGEIGHRAEGFEDCIPGAFPTEWQELSAFALRIVAVLGAEDPGLEAYPALHQRIDTVWKLSLRLLEAITVEVTDERMRTAA